MSMSANLDRWLSPFNIDAVKLYRLASLFSETYKYLALNSTEQFLPTPVTSLPTGEETGKFLAIDLGGTNLRVGFLELLGSNQDGAVTSDSNGSFPGAPLASKSQGLAPPVRRSHERSWPIGEHLKMDRAEDLFDWLGDCVAEVVAASVSEEKSLGIHVSKEITMGITFSFPMIQKSLADATLMPMGKGFAITTNLNLGAMLLAGYERHTKRAFVNGQRSKSVALPRVKIAAITNDTVATLASLAYSVKSEPHSRVAMGLIVGTGCNATIPMKLEALHPSKRTCHSLLKKPRPIEHETIINTEWTINGAVGPLRDLDLVTRWDMLLDKATDAPGFQPFEYMVAGRYLGELVRLMFVDWLTRGRGVSRATLPALLGRRNALTTTFLATIVAPAEDAGQLAKTLNLNPESAGPGNWTWTAEFSGAIQRITHAVERRSAALIAAAVIGLLTCTGELTLNENEGDSRLGAEQDNPQNLDTELVVAYTGGLITQHPCLKNDIQKHINLLLECALPLNAGTTVVLREASDGGIIGAGVLAATAYEDV
ncbi:hexokinase family protein [Lasallia pustulata]|uniref:Phosphotransferase n=1 Tax=Lasallia pustulata TaxID=136370 RepID=A0A1W5D8U1_9LECA|nr:hexokinase family protein [Lasallia pustulata]